MRQNSAHNTCSSHYQGLSTTILLPFASPFVYTALRHSVHSNAPKSAAKARYSSGQSILKTMITSLYAILKLFLGSTSTSIYPQSKRRKRSKQNKQKNAPSIFRASAAPNVTSAGLIDWYPPVWINYGSIVVIGDTITTLSCNGHSSQNNVPITKGPLTTA